MPTVSFNEPESSPLTNPACGQPSPACNQPSDIREKFCFIPASELHKHLPQNREKLSRIFSSAELRSILVDATFLRMSNNLLSARLNLLRRKHSLWKWVITSVLCGLSALTTFWFFHNT